MRAVSLVVVSYNSAPWLAECLRSIRAASEPLDDVVVVDNDSTDGSADVVRRQFPDVTLIENPTNLGFAGGANVGIRMAKNDLVVLLNPDVEVGPTTITSLVEALRADPKAAIAGAKLVYPDRSTIQHAGGRITYPLALANHIGYGEEDRGQHDELREVEYVTGALFAVRRHFLDEIGQFDEGFYPAYFEEADLCLRARDAGYKVLYVPSAVAVHHESTTIGKYSFEHYRLYHRNRIRLVLKRYTDVQIWRDFFPAELERSLEMSSAIELTTVYEAYRDNLAVLEGRDAFIVNQSAAAPLPRSQKRSQVLRILEAISVLRARREVVERPFLSSIPVAGSLVVRVRRLWNWMSTKWYVRPLLQQQNDFNAQVVDALRALVLSVQATESSLIDRKRVDTDHDVDLPGIARRLEELEQQVAEVRRMLAVAREPQSPRT